jgi:hypothetical protein
MSVIKVDPRNETFSAISNATIRNHRLSWAARGFLTYMVGHPANWHFRIEHFCRETGTGRDRAYGMIAELMAAGYCRKERPRRANGTLGPVEYVFSARPLTEKPEVAPGQSTTSGLARRGSARSGKREATKKESQQRKTVESREEPSNSKDSLRCIDTPAATLADATAEARAWENLDDIFGPEGDQ